MRDQLNIQITFPVPATAPSWTAGTSSRPFPPAKPAPRRQAPRPRSVPRPRPLPKPGGNR
ncbi:hypothetical protein GCM10010156_34130 [Planobispora rosea]|uniref:Uncharacterized protein n=1 Tax=Planobispora rosea TaxID=35762 RepID=A0A8J3WDW6_PLARO|nr:hypothetical protein [Planobispora rosea]GGS72437.1 hypothetical protein GCM10010156_34130 [Planobispora rosea]GIH85277.1 hypothetical protein Pro02_36850 [Planobispora rosea]